jgi:hypothetical protein
MDLFRNDEEFMTIVLYGLSKGSKLRLAIQNASHPHVSFPAVLEWWGQRQKSQR